MMMWRRKIFIQEEKHEWRLFLNKTLHCDSPNHIKIMRITVQKISHFVFIWIAKYAILWFTMWLNFLWCVSPLPKNLFLIFNHCCASPPLLLWQTVAGELVNMVMDGTNYQWLCFCLLEPQHFRKVWVRVGCHSTVTMSVAWFTGAQSTSSMSQSLWMESILR